MLSGMTARDTLAPEMAFMYAERSKGDTALDYPVGGVGAIVDALVRGLERWGGTLHLASPVAGVELEGGRVYFVEGVHAERTPALVVLGPGGGAGARRRNGRRCGARNTAVCVMNAHVPQKINRAAATHRAPRSEPSRHTDRGESERHMRCPKSDLDRRGVCTSGQTHAQRLRYTRDAESDRIHGRRHRSSGCLYASGVVFLDAAMDPHVEDHRGEHRRHGCSVTEQQAP